MNMQHPVKAALRECRPLFMSVFWFSFFINILMLAVPLYSLQVLDRVLSSGSTDTLLMLTIIVTSSLLFMGLLQGLRTLVFSQIGRWLDERLSMDTVEKTVGLALHKPGIGSQPLRDLAVIKSFLSSPAFASLFDAPWAIIYFITIYVINVTLGIVVTLGAAVLLILAFVAKKMPEKSATTANEEQVQAMQAFDAILRNAEVIQAMGLLQNAVQKWSAHQKEHLQLSFSVSNVSTVISSSTRTIRMGLQILLTGLGAYLALSGHMSSGSIVAVSMIAGRALAPFDAALSIYQSWVGVKKSYKRLGELEEVALEEHPGLTMPEPKGDVSIEKVTYQEGQNKHWILRGINIEVAAGESVGIIGPSGAGKTTLGRILVGVLRPTSGAVRLDGAVLDQWNPDQLGPLIGYLPQDVELFNGSIAENIARLDEGAEGEDVIRAAQLAEVHDFILQLPQGYHTKIGPHGTRLSAGQRQRIALARCFYGKPKLVLLDEPNANLDTAGEQALVQCLLNAKAEGITVFIIAHRPIVLQKVDKILVLHEGEAKLFGPAEEVLARLTQTSPNVRPFRKVANDSPGGVE